MAWNIPIFRYQSYYLRFFTLVPEVFLDFSLFEMRETRSGKRESRLSHLKRRKKSRKTSGTRVKIFNYDFICVFSFFRFLTYDPSKRITAEKALDHEYFSVSVPLNPKENNV